MISNYFQEFIYRFYYPVKREESVPKKVIDLVLVPPEKIYKMGIRIRNGLYKKGILKVKEINGVKIVSIGNITLGGTGKTPLTIFLANKLKSKGYRVGVVSRGYGGKNREAPLVVSNGKEILSIPEEAGDEPILIAKKSPKIPVCVYKERYLAAKILVERFGVNLILMDDGFQHLRLKRDLDIVLLGSPHGIGNEHIFPRGPLREDPSSLRRADGIVITSYGTELNLLENTYPFLKDMPIFFCNITPSFFWRLRTFEGDIWPLSYINNMRVVLISGLARPSGFESIIRSLGADIMKHFAFPDHHMFRSRELKKISAWALRNGADLIITTEKDYVRIERKKSLTFKTVAISMEVDFHNSEEEFLQFVERALCKSHESS